MTVRLAYAFLGPTKDFQFVIGLPCNLPADSGKPSEQDKSTTTLGSLQKNWFEKNSFKKY